MRWRIPLELVSHNATQFSLEEFRDFKQRYGFSHITSSPHYPQANGAAERAIQTAKHLLKQPDPCLALMCCYAIAATGASPAQLMTVRQIHTIVLVLKKILLPRQVNWDLVKQRDTAAKEAYRFFYNRRHSKLVHSLSCGPVKMLGSSTGMRAGKHLPGSLASLRSWEPTWWKWTMAQWLGATDNSFRLFQRQFQYQYGPTTAGLQFPYCSGGYSTGAPSQPSPRPALESPLQSWRVTSRGLFGFGFLFCGFVLFFLFVFIGLKEDKWKCLFSY